MTSDDVHLAAKGHHAVVQTVRILLEARAQTAVCIGPDECDILSLEVLLVNTVGYETRQTGVRTVWNDIHKHKLFVHLVKILLKSDVDVDGSAECYGFDTIRVAARYIMSYDILTNISEKLSVVDNYNMVLNGMSDLFSFLIQSPAVKSSFDKEWNHCSIDRDVILQSIITIAGFCSKPGHTKKLIRLILDGMTTNHLAKLESMLASRLSSITSADSRHASIISALEFVGEVETPRRLQHLARLTITHSLFGNGLPYAQILPDVTIPKLLRQYLAYC